MIYVLIGFGYLIDLLFIIHDEKKHDGLSLVFKTLASLSFVLLALLLSFKINNRIIAGLIVVALVFDLLGDFILILRNVFPNKHDLIYIVGTACFFIAHIFLLIMLIINNPNVILKSILLASIFFIVFYFAVFNKLEMSKTFRVIGLFYLYFILYILAYSVFSYANFSTKFELAFLFGYFLFCVSDLILMIHKFKKGASSSLQPLYRLSYFISQILIALSISLL